MSNILILLIILIVISLTFYIWVINYYILSIIPSSNNNRILEKSFVINLPHRTDRMKRMTDILKENNFERIDGVIVNEFPTNAKITKAEYGCTLAHLNILKKIATLQEYDKDGKELWYAIFEDDMKPMCKYEEFITNLNKILNSLPINARLINLGPDTNKFNLYKLFNYICRGKPYVDEFTIIKGFFMWTQSYCIRPSQAKKCIDLIEENMLNFAIDKILSTSYLFTSDVYSSNLTTQDRESPSDIRKL